MSRQIAKAREEASKLLEMEEDVVEESPVEEAPTEENSVSSGFSKLLADINDGE